VSLPALWQSRLLCERDNRIGACPPLDPCNRPQSILLDSANLGKCFGESGTIGRVKERLGASVRHVAPRRRSGWTRRGRRGTTAPMKGRKSTRWEVSQQSAPPAVRPRRMRWRSCDLKRPFSTGPEVSGGVTRTGSASVRDGSRHRRSPGQVRSPKSVPPCGPSATHQG
jgi:hypothetical protein